MVKAGVLTAPPHRVALSLGGERQRPRKKLEAKVKAGGFCFISCMWLRETCWPGHPTSRGQPMVWRDPEEGSWELWKVWKRGVG